MPRHLIGDAHEWINEIPTVPTHSLAKLQPSQRSWDLYLCVLCVTWVLPPTYFFTDSVSCFGITTGCYVQQRGKKTLLSLTLICYCHLVGMAKIVRGSTFIVRPWNTATWRFGWLTVLALPFYSISKTQTYVQLFDSLRRSLNSFVWAFIIHQIQIPSGILMGGLVPSLYHLCNFFTP